MVDKSSAAQGDKNAINGLKQLDEYKQA